MVSLDSLSLHRLLAQNSFALPSGIELCFVGLRGAVPAGDGSDEFQKNQHIQLADVNYVNPRCTIVQWRPATGEMAIFPGSTVPHVKEVRRAFERGGQGANQLMTGFHRDFVKGVHYPSADNAHQAFVQGGAWPYRRTADNLTYDNNDPAEVAIVWDNLHAAWSGGPESTVFESAGCQVVCGFPDTAKRRRQRLGETGAWARFRQNAYAIQQTRFPYVLLEARDLERAAPRLRFGSRGSKVEQMQRALTERGQYRGPVSGTFGPDTLRAVMAFQTSALGAANGDGIVGPDTARLLGVTLE